MPERPSPAVQRRCDQARHNFRAFERLRGDGEFLDWAVTTLFYSALQLVDAHAFDREGEFAAHVDRRLYVKLTLRPVSVHYARLEDASRAARYEQWRPSNIQVEALLRDYQRVAGYLKTLGIST